MCGILAEYSFKRNQLSHEDDFKSILKLSEKRGPDASGYFKGAYYQLGFNRLAILDLSERGNQPMLSPSGRYHMVFNGEIYNFKTLVETYDIKNLKSTSDTEVVLHLFEKLGIESTLQQLDGMFGIAVLDSQSEELILARDFAGIKPVFYGISNNGLAIASQFDQIFKHNWFNKELQLRPEILKEYLGFGYMQAPNTIYENIKQLKPGFLLEVNRKGQITEKPFIKIDFAKPQVEVNSVNRQFEEEVNHALNDSVRAQLVSDVSLATFLSGGIDSPLITAISKQNAKNIKAFTVAVNNKDMDEGEAAEQYAEDIDVAQEIHRIDEEQIISIIEEHFKEMTEPFGDYSSIPTYLITKLAKQENTVMLSGDGGDELFFGYPRMLDVMKKRTWFYLPFRLRRLLIRLTNKLKLTNTWAPYHYRTIGEWVAEKHTHIFKSELDSFFNGIEFSKDIYELYSRDTIGNKHDLLQWLRFNEFYGHMQRILIKVDRMSMANSMEVRVPFLSKQSIRTALKFVPKKYTNTANLKEVLKRLMALYFPQSSINKKKKGFTVPLDNWLKNELKAEVQSTIFESNIYGAEIINEAAVKSYVKKYYDGEHDSAWGIWHIYSWQKWAQIHGLV